MKLSISNLSWGETPIKKVAPMLKEIGIQGIEIAPTAIWGDINEVSMKLVQEYSKIIYGFGLKISGVQSLLFGHPEFQLFDKSCWPAMKSHLQKNIEIAGALGASVAVFGSPKNRIKSSMKIETANEIAVDFFTQLTPYLKDANLILTLEPNAPYYGADFITKYSHAVNIAATINSSEVKPQIDTGCAILISEDPIEIYKFHRPAHIHLSAPNLVPIPSSIDFVPFLELLVNTNYQEWLVIEMLSKSEEAFSVALSSARWLKQTLKEKVK